MSQPESLPSPLGSVAASSSATAAAHPETAKVSNATTPANLAPNEISSAPDAPATDPASLSADEQHARFVEALKESDWGHQPC